MEHLAVRLVVSCSNWINQLLGRSSHDVVPRFMSGKLNLCIWFLVSAR